MSDFLKGFSYAMAGFSWIVRPKIRRFVYVPLIINMLLFALAFGVLNRYASFWIGELLGEKSDWWRIFQWAYALLVPLLMVLAYIAMTLIVYFSFSSLANLIAAPFNAQLAKVVEQQLAGQSINYAEISLSQEVRITVKSEIAKISRFIGLALVLLILLIIPVVNSIFPFVWFIFMAYTLSIQYVDYPMANHQLYYKAQRACLRKNRMQRLGFGSAANLMVLLPIINFIAMPVCVCGATVWWHNSLSND